MMLLLQNGLIEVNEQFRAYCDLPRLRRAGGWRLAARLAATCKTSSFGHTASSIDRAYKSCSIVQRTCTVCATKVKLHFSASIFQYC